MLTKVWEKAGEAVAKQVMAGVLAPAAVFWVVGLAAWVWNAGTTRSDGLVGLGKELAVLPAIVQIVIVVAALVAVVSAAVIAERLTLPLLRLLEGYWPGSLGAVLRRRLHRRRAKALSVAQQLEAERRKGGLSSADADRLARAQARLRSTPSDVGETMPTRFGNRLRAAELRPRAKHGLDVVACWPHLWLVLDTEAKSELGQARADLDMGACALGWSLAAMLWTPLAWWSLPVGLSLAVAIYYGWLLDAAQRYGDLVEATFDLFHPRLYQTLRWPLPDKPENASQNGLALTQFVWQGIPPQNLTFEQPVAGS